MDPTVPILPKDLDDIASEDLSQKGFCKVDENEAQQLEEQMKSALSEVELNQYVPGARDLVQGESESASYEPKSSKSESATVCSDSWSKCESSGGKSVLAALPKWEPVPEWISWAGKMGATNEKCTHDLQEVTEIIPWETATLPRKPIPRKPVEIDDWDDGFDVDDRKPQVSQNISMGVLDYNAPFLEENGRPTFEPLERIFRWGFFSSKRKTIHWPSKVSLENEVGTLGNQPFQAKEVHDFFKNLFHKAEQLRLPERQVRKLLDQALKGEMSFNYRVLRRHRNLLGMITWFDKVYCQRPSQGKYRLMLLNFCRVRNEPLDEFMARYNDLAILADFHENHVRFTLADTAIQFMRLSLAPKDKEDFDNWNHLHKFENQRLPGDIRYRRALCKARDIERQRNTFRDFYQIIFDGVISVKMWPSKIENDQCLRQRGARSSRSQTSFDESDNLNLRWVWTSK